MIESLTPRERQVYEAIVANGSVPHGTRREVARRLRMSANCLSVLLAKVRAKTGAPFQPKRPGKQRDQEKIKSIKTPRLAHSEPMADEEPAETPGQARERVRREIAAGQRCPRCHLLLPHEGCV